MPTIRNKGPRYARRAASGAAVLLAAGVAAALFPGATEAGVISGWMRRSGWSAPGRPILTMVRFETMSYDNWRSMMAYHGMYRYFDSFENYVWGSEAAQAAASAFSVIRQINASNRTCSNLYGAHYEVPFGNYSGDQLIKKHDFAASGLGSCVALEGPQPPTFAFRRTSDPIPLDDRQSGRVGGWNFEPEGNLSHVWEIHRQRTVQIINPNTGNNQDAAECTVVARFKYESSAMSMEFRQTPAEQTCVFNSWDPTKCGTGRSDVTGATCSVPAQHWSVDGQIALDAANLDAPVLRYPDGNVEVFGRKEPLPLIAWGSVPSAAPIGPWKTDTLTDRNGNRVTFGYDASGKATSITDPHGRTTSYIREPGRVTACALTSPGSGYTSAPTVTLGGGGGSGATATCSHSCATGTCGISFCAVANKGDGYVTPPTATLSGGGGTGAVVECRITTGKITQIRTPGMGGVPQTWTFSWSRHDFDVDAEFGPNFCRLQPLGSTGAEACAPTTCNLVPMYTLDELVQPDGRKYSFQYGDFANLTQVTEPNGRAMVWGYGDDNTTSDWPATWEYGQCPVNTDKLMSRRVVSTTEYPLGLGTTGAVSTITHEGITDITTPANGKCGSVSWRRIDLPDGSYERHAYCIETNGKCTPAPGGSCLTPTRSTGLNNFLFESQQYSATGVLLEKVTHGDWTTGVPFATWETQTEFQPHIPIGGTGAGAPMQPTYLDIRPTKILYWRQGLSWSEHLTYEASPVVLSGGTRTWGNIATKIIRDANDAVLVQTANTYLHGATTYNPLNIIRLLQSETVSDGAGNVQRRINHSYDEAAHPLVGSGQPNLVSAGTHRGNATSETQYTNPASSTGALVKHTQYFDNGAPKRVTDPRGNVSSDMVAWNFGLCPSNPTVSTTINDVFGRGTSVTADCYTGASLSTTDINGKVTSTVHDEMGRPIKTILPGDTVANPSAWTEYCLFGSTANASACGTMTSIRGNRTVAHTKDGSATGKYTKTFVDGLGRTIQTCSKIDPAFSHGAGSNNEACTYTTFDVMGRVSQEYAPYYAASVLSSAQPTSGPVTTTTYDALDRVTSVTFPGGFVESTNYSGDATELVSITRDAKGYGTRKTTDALGRVVSEHHGCTVDAEATVSTEAHPFEIVAIEPTEELWTVSGCAYFTKMTYDALDRMLTTAEGGSAAAAEICTLGATGNCVQLTYDGLSRKKTLSDPDMGNWSYDYDENGNLTTQIDAKLQTISMFYDAANRLTLKDVPPAGPDMWDETYFYDGDVPTSCRSCWDPVSGVTGICNTTTFTCFDVAGETSGGDLTDPGDPGDPTDLPPGSTCNLASQCASGICADGVCCTTSCGSCGTCAAGTGLCATNPQGSAGSPDCAPYVCSGSSTNCPISCSSSSSCASGNVCSGGLCVPGSGSSPGYSGGNLTISDGGSGSTWHGNIVIQPGGSGANIPGTLTVAP